MVQASDLGSWVQGFWDSELRLVDVGISCSGKKDWGFRVWAYKSM